MNLAALTALGVTGASLSFNQQGHDELTLTRAAKWDEDWTWAYGEEISIEVGAETIFRGWCRQLPSSGTDGKESQRYVFTGPSWFLDRLVYQQEWKVRSVENDPESTWAARAFARIRAGLTALGAKQNTGATILDVLNYAVSAGKPITPGVILTGVDAPTDQFDQATCWEVIQRMLRWTPDAVAWWDYSVNPPALHIRRRADLTAVSLDVDPTAEADRHVTSSDITPRYDLVVGGVVLTYRWGGADSPFISQDVYPPAASETADNALVAVIDLEMDPGSPGQYIRQDIVTADIDITDLEWWKSKVQWLNNEKIQNITIFDPAGFNDDLPRELVEGTITPWMSKTAETVTITATVDYEYIDSGDVIRKVQAAPISFTLTVTDAATRTYKKFIPGQAGSQEPKPVGLAQALHSALSVLHWDGTVSTVEREAAASVRIGHVLNLTNGRTEWATMNAVVQNIEIDLMFGRTTIKFGPPEHLGPQDLVALLKPLRIRVSSNTDRDPENNDDSTEVDISGATPNGHGTHVDAVIVKQIFRTFEPNGKKIEVDGSSGKIRITQDDPALDITLDLADIPSGAGVIKMRELDYCDGTSAKKIAVLCSAPY